MIMNCIYKKPGMSPHKVQIKNELEKLQEIVEGNIETVHIADGIILICNEEGKLNGMQPSIFLPMYRDVVYGPVLIVGENEAGDDFDSLSEKDLNLVYQLIGSWTPER